MGGGGGACGLQKPASSKTQKGEGGGKDRKLSGRKIERRGSKNPKLLRKRRRTAFEGGGGIVWTLKKGGQSGGNEKCAFLEDEQERSKKELQEGSHGMKAKP